VRLAFVGLVGLVACGDDGAGPRDAAPDDVAVDAVELLPSATRMYTECATTGTGTRPCTLEIRLDPAACANAACDKLVVWFAGGNQTCSTQTLDAYVAAGYVATCALLFGDSVEAGAYPYNAEAGRVDVLIRGATSDPLIRAAWSGTKLLIAGSSHGATAPVIAMARTALDSDASWKGSSLTGACFADGIYDIGALDELLGDGDNGQPCPPPPNGVLSHARALGRYYSSDPAAHSCANSQCACAAGHSAELDEDTIVAVSPTELAIERWKLIECGSNLAACTGDVVPGAPVQALCTAIEADATHTCELTSLPTVPHTGCAPASQCITWFDAL